MFCLLRNAQMHDAQRAVHAVRELDFSALARRAARAGATRKVMLLRQFSSGVCATRS
ncbi:hypothetical protein A2U01_0093373 [Trifolium medium]|uniref:Uncharacterized protein n=1 Tax=Trifolium medium TaxID=97028 RepID=A0A392UI71_9FABA|nr:hypothetical protein [Trifolium medium]